MVGIESREAGLGQLVEPRHVRLGELKAEQVGVLPLVLGIERFRNGCDAVLQAPAQDHLRGLHAHAVGDFGNRRMTQQCAASERRPGNGLNAVILAERDRGHLGVAGMDLELVDHGGNLGFGKQRHKMVHEEVAHADGAHDPALVEFLEGSPGARIDALPGHGFALRGGPLHEEEIDVLESEGLEGCVECLDCGAIAAVRVPELGGDEELAPGQAAHFNCAGNRALVAVDVRRVKVPVAEFDSRGQSGKERLFFRDLPRAKTDARKLHSVAEGKPALNRCQFGYSAC